MTLKIGMVTAFFPPNIIGGAEISSYYLSRALARSGDVVHVVSPDFNQKDETEKTMKKEKEISIHYFHYPFSMKEDVLISRLLTYNPIFQLLLLIHTIRAVKKYRLQVLHGHEDEGNIATFMASMITGVPYVLTIRDWRAICHQSFCMEQGRVLTKCGFKKYVRCSTRMARGSKVPPLYLLGSVFLYLIWKMNRKALEHADHLICVSKFLKERLIDDGLKNKQITSINDITRVGHEIEPLDVGIDFEKVSVIAFAGRIEFKKGVHTLVESLNEVVKEVPSKLVLIGDFENPYGEEIKSKIKESGLEDFVVFTGKLQNSQVLYIFKNAGVVVIPSIWPEPQGRTVLEALSVGTPLVAASSGGIPEMVREEDGILVEPGNPHEMAQGILTILRRDGKRSLTHPKKELQEDFILRQHIKIYKEAIEDHKT